VPDDHLAVLRAPSALSAGSRVVVVAPSGPVDAGRLARGSALLRSLGLEVSPGSHVLDRDDHGYLAGTDLDRAADLQDAWCDPGVDGIFCARGGYGAVRLLDHLDWAAMRAASAGRPPKPLVGSSDVTALHQAFAHHLGVTTHFGPTAAGPILGTENPGAATVNALREALFRPTAPVLVHGGQALYPGRSSFSATASGVTTGGTLALLCSMLGSAEARPARGGIVFLEDVGESPYRIDRMLTQLRRSGWLDGVAGIACGSWEKCGPAARVVAVLRDRLGDLGVPVVTGLPFGHGPAQVTIPLGQPAVLDADAGTVRIPGP
jgi:muramoyltetrapeptide carboxypeptidase